MITLCALLKSVTLICRLKRPLRTSQLLQPLRYLCVLQAAADHYASFSTQEGCSLYEKSGLFCCHTLDSFHAPVGCLEAILCFPCLSCNPVLLHVQGSTDSRRYVLEADETGAPPQQPASATSSPIASATDRLRTNVQSADVHAVLLKQCPAPPVPQYRLFVAAATNVLGNWWCWALLSLCAWFAEQSACSMPLLQYPRHTLKTRHCSFHHL